VLVAVAGVAAGYVNSIAGAGSLLTLPALIFSGLDASAANATNRIGVLLQSLTAVVAFRRAGVDATRTTLWLALPAMTGAAAGTYVATLLSNDQIRIAIVACMLVMLPLSFVRPRAPSGVDPKQVPPATPAMALTFAALGAYAGFIQAGAGVLILLTLSLVHRAPLVASNAIKMGIVLVVAILSVTLFFVLGQTLEPIRGIVLGIATSVGSWFGAKHSVTRGERFIRVAVAVAVLASAAKVLLDTLL